MAATFAPPARAAGGFASGLAPMATFPNSHLAQLPRGAPSAPGVGVAWAAKQQGSALSDLRRAVQEEDWERNYEEGLTRISMRAEWCASEDRCSALRWLAMANKAKRVLEVGSFCGAGALALAEAVPPEGEVQAIEFDPFVVDFGRKFRLKSMAGAKINVAVGRATEELQKLAAQAQKGEILPFDLVIVDADKEGMQQYFDLLWSTPGLLSERAVVCVDTTPFKGQPPLRYVKFGFPHRWQSASGEEEIAGLRRSVQARTDLRNFEFCGMIVTTRTSA